MHSTDARLDGACRIEKLDASTPAQSFRMLAELHFNSIHGGVMEALGPNFLTAFYEQLSKGRDVLMYAAQRDRKTVGFVAGTLNLARSIKGIGFLGMARLTLAGCTGLWRPSLLKRVFQTFAYFFRPTYGSTDDMAKVQAANPERSELLAIAVAKEARGQGIGKSLVEALERDLRNHGLRRTYFVSTKRDEIGSNAFYRAAGFTLIGQKRHHDLTLNVYKRDLNV